MYGGDGMAVPPEMEQIIGRAMARDLDYRYRDASELHRDLRNFQLQLSHISTGPLPLPSKPMPPHLPPHLSPMTQQQPRNPLRTAPPASPAPPETNAPYSPYNLPPRRQRDEW